MSISTKPMTKIITAKQVGKIGKYKVILEEKDTRKIHTADAMMDMIRKHEDGEPWRYWEVRVD